uniref:Rbsn domain-containing protein n=1 Tax=Angiostrongylus cantonensis TaxID=6313 RepID=A0A0K0DDH9_ANGCA
MTDLGDFPRLQNHVSTVHPERKQDLTDTVNIGVSNSEADLANMASTAQGRVSEKSRSSRPMAVVRPSHIRAEIGATRSHTQYFNKVRDSSVNESAIRTNMLIIRLDRLINECPSDPLRRKGRLTNPALAAEMLEADITSTTDTVSSHSRRLLEMTQKTTGKVVSFIEGAVSKMQTATDGSEDAQECLRVCGSCMTDLSRREQMMEQRNPPVLAEQYETLDRMIADASAMVPSYTRMSNSINNGETMYTLAAAEELRSRLFEKQHDIDNLSQRIAAEAEKEHCGVKEAQLRRNIRLASVQALQTMVSKMVSLPTPQKYEMLVEKHKKEVARQIEEARLRTTNELGSVRPSTSLPSVALRDQTSLSTVHERPRKQTEDGWTPQQTKTYNPFMEDEERLHPLFEQRDIIKGYLSQAATAGRLEEVEILERNLKYLEDEMFKMGLISPT